MRVDVMDKVLEPSNTCSHKITNIMYERLEPTGFNWKAVSKETKDFYFEEFKAKELKRKPHPREVFKHTHFKAGKWVDEKSKLTHEAIEDLLKQNSQKVDGSAESQIVDEVGAYFDAVGGRNKKYRVYGIGSSQNIFYGLGKSYNNGVSETSQFHDDDCQMMQAKLHDMEDQMKVMQERQKYHLKAIQEQQQEQLKAIQEEHKERLTTLENRIADMVKSTRLFNLA
ncbi:hypothetical protein AgCh_016925 [Apium graveolens]